METCEGFLFWSQETHLRCMLLAGVSSNMCCVIGSPQTDVVNNRCKHGPFLTIWVSLCSLDRHFLNVVWWKAAQYQRREIKQVCFHRHASLPLIFICIFVSAFLSLFLFCHFSILFPLYVNLTLISLFLSLSQVKCYQWVMALCSTKLQRQHRKPWESCR